MITGDSTTETEARIATEIIVTATSMINQVIFPIISIFCR